MIDPALDGVLELVSELYLRYHGAKPSHPIKRDRARLAELIVEHGEAEAKARVTRAFEQPPDFPRGPWDVRTIVQHFDKLVPRQRVAGSAGRTANGLAAGRFEPGGGHVAYMPPVHKPSPPAAATHTTFDTSDPWGES